jgi:hypothetical protein
MRKRRQKEDELISTTKIDSQDEDILKKIIDKK